MKGQWGRLAGYFLGTALVSAAITIGLPMLGGGGWLPDLISSEGRRIDELFWGIGILSIIIFAVVGAVVIYSITHFRAEPGDLSDGEHIHGNAAMELSWIIIPSIIVFVIGVLSYVVLEENEIGLYDETSAKRGLATMNVDVRGFQFGWSFRYADERGEPLAVDAEPSSELVLPVGEIVRFNVISCSGEERLGRVREEALRELSAHGGEHRFAAIKPGICEQEWDQTTEEDVAAVREEVEQLHEIEQKLADGKELTKEERTLWEAQPDYRGDRQHIDVNHAFWVPEARMKIDAVAGLRTYVQWKPTKVTGPKDTYNVVCAELCGTGHNGMQTAMCVVDRGTFDWWVGLEEEARADATCVNLRLFSCFDEVDAHDDLLADLAALTRDKPEATCDEAEEAAA